MNAAVVHSLDAPPRYTEFADPVPNEGEVIVSVTAAGLHPIVKSLANGTHYGSTGELPFIPGVDGVGRLPDGASVYFGMARSPFGTFAERVVAPRRMCLRLPEGLDDPAVVAGIVNPGMSSWVALQFRAALVAGESVLILGATGAAGHLAVQIAKRLGARRVVAAGRNQRALEELTGLGADAIISLDQEHPDLVSAFRRERTEEGLDIVLDYVWGQPAEAVLEAISQKGRSLSSGRLRYVQVGESAGKTISLRAGALRSSGLELLGSGFGSASLDQIWRALEEFFKVAAESPFRFHIKTAPLREVEALWNTAQQGVRLVFQP